MSHTGPAETASQDYPETPLASSRWWKPSRWARFVTPAIAVLAVAIAVAAWFRAAHAPTFSNDQTAQAKTNICAAYTTVRQAEVANTNLGGPSDPIGHLAVAANARLALLGGGTYLQNRLEAEPATPANLAKAVNSWANAIEQLGVNYLAGAPDAAQDPVRHDVDAQAAQINDMCK